MSEILIPGDDDLEATARDLARRTPFRLEAVRSALERLTAAGAELGTVVRLIEASAPVGGFDVDALLAIARQVNEWRLERHSGRDADVWRTIYRGDEKGARGRFQALSTALRQGGLRLYHGTTRIEGVWAPRLRTRW